MRLGRRKESVWTPDSYYHTHKGTGLEYREDEEKQWERRLAPSQAEKTKLNTTDSEKILTTHGDASKTDA